MECENESSTLTQVWAKGKGFSWWPAVILANGIEDVDEPETKKLLKKMKKTAPASVLQQPDHEDIVLFYATREHAWKYTLKIQRFDPTQEKLFREACYKKTKSKSERLSWDKAVQEAKEAMEGDEPDDRTCEVCEQDERHEEMLLCDACDAHYHFDCLTPPLLGVPEDDWFCPECAPSHQPPAKKQKLEHIQPHEASRSSDAIACHSESNESHTAEDKPQATSGQGVNSAHIAGLASIMDHPPKNVAESANSPAIDDVVDIQPATPVPPIVSDVAAQSSLASRPPSMWSKSCEFTFQTIHIGAADVRRVLGKRWYNDNLIDLYTEVLMLRAKKLKRQFFMANCAFHLHVLGLGTKSSSKIASAAQRWWKDTKLFDQNALFIPVNLKESHWAMICVLNPAGAFQLYKGADALTRVKKAPALVFVDSLQNPCPDDVPEAIMLFLHHRFLYETRQQDDSELNSLTIDAVVNKQLWKSSAFNPTSRTIKAKIPKQDNKYDCGVYALHCTEIMASKEFCRKMERTIDGGLVAKIEQGEGLLNFPAEVITAKRELIYRIIRTLEKHKPGSKNYEKITHPDDLPAALDSLLEEDPNARAYRDVLAQEAKDENS
uniref:PHD-type domain-containing protein n=1 Tax=Eutreptiella gymnastica TaxID=73025 RepID=A0A6U8GBU0_9EUGL|mmetsp:Transcript_46705/g.83631  ORF Transcript_46705/g.83631 Transcript_46705/m.83631 type:complete len:606 (+) Transcript_46705:92-1909(+)